MFKLQKVIFFHFFSGGTEYTKDFKVKSDARKCITYKHIGTTQYTNYELSAGGEIDTTFHYKCFERDPWWGKLSAIFIFLPGKCKKDYDMFVKGTIHLTRLT